MNERIKARVEKLAKRLEKAKTHIKKDSHKLKKAERYDTDVKNGLTEAQVLSRIEDGLTNKKPINRTKSYARIIFENVFNFCNTVTILLCVLLVLVGRANETVSSCIILLNMAIGIAQEIKAKWTVGKLSLRVESTCEVIRDGKTATVPSSELVLDDLFLIRSGMQVPVDCEILEGHAEIDESILTGESEAVIKLAGLKALAGSYVVSGEAYARAEKVGKDCYIENIAKVARRVSKPRSNIFSVLDRIIKGITFALIPLAALLFVSTYVSAGASLNDTVVKVAGSVLGMLPIGMFLLTSTALASSVLKLSKKNTLAQDLYSVEMLAMVDTLLLDKTGTITDGKLTVTDELFISEELEAGGLCPAVIINSLLTATKDINPTALAMKAKFEGSDTLEIDTKLPFSSHRKYSAIEYGGKTYVLGAPDYVTASESKALSDFIKENSRLCRRSLLLGVSDGGIDGISKENTRPVYAMALDDNLRDDVKDTLRWFRDNGVDIKIVSGDDPITVSEIALKTGVFEAEKYVNCAGLDDAELEKHAVDSVVLGRVSPEQKSKIVHILQEKGRVVGMIGDGVNDVQALKDADCSISFASANEVARNISRIIMLDSNFKSLPDAVKEGRRVIGNVEKVSALYIMKNLFVMAVSFIYAIIGFFAKDILYPFEPARMLMIEAFVIGVPTFCLALQASKRAVEGDFLKNILKSAFPAGISLVAGVGLILMLTATGAIGFGGVTVGDIEKYKITLAVLTLTFSGFSALFIVSLPKNKFRLAVIGIMTAVSVAALWLENLVFPEEGFFLNIYFITDIVHILWIALGVAFATAVNIGLRKVFSYVDERYGERIGAVYSNFKKRFRRKKTA